MEYPTGEMIKLGDVIKVWDGCTGVVVCSIEHGEYSETYLEKDWAYLQRGILVTTDAGGLMHLPQIESDVELIERKA